MYGGGGTLLQSLWICNFHIFSQVIYTPLVFKTVYIKASKLAVQEQ